MYWLHDSGGYTFHGDAPITGLTPMELDLLLLGHLLHHEIPGSDRRDSHKQSIERRHREYTDELFADLGFQ